MSNKESISRNKPKIIVDISFLLPAMGISTDEEFINFLKTRGHSTHNIITPDKMSSSI
ncbi:MAG: hypothetical protein HA495_06025 [Thaumarchaeota archaeon]|nr:hypothetical protein [Nitrososphaerota archaeon]